MNSKTKLRSLGLTWGLSKRILPSVLGLRWVFSKSPMVVCLVNFVFAWNFSGTWAGRWWLPSSVNCLTMLVLKKTISLYYPNQTSMSNIQLILSSTQKYVSKESHDEKLHLFSLGRKMPSPSIDISLTILFLEIKNEIWLPGNFPWVHVLDCFFVFLSDMTVKKT